jgi:hypothetical protein
VVVAPAAVEPVRAQARRLVLVVTRPVVGQQHPRPHPAVQAERSRDAYRPDAAAASPANGIAAYRYRRTQ